VTVIYNLDKWNSLNKTVVDLLFHRPCKCDTCDFQACYKKEGC